MLRWGSELLLYRLEEEGELVLFTGKYNLGVDKEGQGRVGVTKKGCAGVDS